MIHKLEITNLRGICSGSLKEMAPLTILVGPNGAGKSTILDAIHLGASPTPGAAIKRSVERRPMPAKISGAKWLLWKSGANGPAEISVTMDDGSVMRSVLKNIDIQDPGHGRLTMDWAPPGGKTTVSYSPSGIAAKPKGNESRPSKAGTVRLIETWTSASQQELHTIHSQATAQGTRSQAIRIIQALISEIQDLEILTEGNNPYLAARYADRAVPVALTGDGVHALIRLCYELAVSSGLVLLEEPEIHQHPAALTQTTEAVRAAVRYGVQVVLSTHSLELIDALVSRARDEEINKMALFRVRLDNKGHLLTSRLQGDEVVLSRTQIEDDLR